MRIAAMRVLSVRQQLPSISVVIPTRNRGKVVQRAINSALYDQHLETEVVVVDDGSSDDTEFIVSRIENSRVRFHRLESTGNANRARNIGARLSTAPLIAFLDSDDVFGPNRLSRLIDFFSRRPDVDCLIDGYIEIRHGTKRVHALPQITPDPHEIRRILIAHLVPLTNSAITLRRTAFDEVGGYDESMSRHQDRELLLRLAKSCMICFGTDTDVEKYRLARSISHDLTGYISGLDALAVRVPEYQLPENMDLFRYLTVRGIVKALATGHWLAAFREFRQWQLAEHLPKEYVRCFRAYRVGKRRRLEDRGIERATTHATGL